MGELTLEDMFNDLTSAILAETTDDNQRKAAIAAIGLGFGIVTSLKRIVTSLKRIADALEKANEPPETPTSTGLEASLRYRLKSIQALIGSEPISEMIKKDFRGLKVLKMKPAMRADLFNRLQQLADAELAKAE